jgi:16S rRNA (cytosine967-C5)-methyltransferase
VILEPKSFRVQDWASQQIAQFLPKESPLFIWDVCAGAGGKSLILSEQFPKAKLLVSDVRPSILRNLEERFKLHRRNLPQMMEIDLTQLPEDVDPLDGKKADLIVCDVPCSGSGTWGRTPEQAWFFKPESINEFSEKQRNIVLRAADFLTDDGTLFYITCSVFASENEDNTKKICESGRLKIIHQTIINGFDNQADCLFVAVLKKV